MSDYFAQRLKELMTQLDISNAQLSKALSVDPSLISRWLKDGCGKRKAPEHALAIGNYVMKRRLSPENQAWLRRTLQGELNASAIACWLYPKMVLTENTPQEAYPNLLVVSSFRSAVLEGNPSTQAVLEKYSVLSACQGCEQVAALLQKELEQLPPKTVVEVFLSSETSAAAIDPNLLAVLRGMVEEKQLKLHFLVQSANNSSMSSRLVSAYMPLLVQGLLEFSVIQGTPQTFTVTMNIVIPDRVAIVVTETVQRRSSAVATIIREPAVLQDLHESFVSSTRFARPMMTAYDDSFARNIIEVFFEEYGIPGSLDVIKSGMNPMYMSLEQYGSVLEKFGHTGDQYQWRYQEFVRFKAAMDEVLKSSRFREVLSLPMLRQIAETGTCRMPSMYFMEAGVWNLDREDCVALLDGYLKYLREIPDFQVVLLDDEQLFMPNSCWHIKNNKHIMIHSWNIDAPTMVYSDQFVLVDEFQRHFNMLWEQTGIGFSMNSCAPGP